MKKILLFIDSEPSVGGVFQYSQSILEATMSLPRSRYEIVIIYTNRLWDRYIGDDLKNVKKVYVPFIGFDKRLMQFILMTGIRLSWLRAWVQSRSPVAKEILNQKPDLCIFPCQETFWSYLTPVPSVVSIHDLMHRYEKCFPEASSFGRYYYREMHFRRICKHVKGIVVDSLVGRQHVHESYAFPMERLFVLPYIAPRYIAEQSVSADVERKYSLPEKYIFYPAQFWEHKNHARLVEAVRSLKDQLPDIQLVLVGSKKNGYKNVAKLVNKMNLQEIVHFMGFVPEKDLSTFYKRATAMVMPTFFGPTNIPPLEAFATGCPVGISNVYGIPVQVGDAALLFDPKSVDDIASVIKQLWIDEDLCNRLIQRGRARIKAWEQPHFNEEFLNIIGKLL